MHACITIYIYIYIYIYIGTYALSLWRSGICMCNEWGPACSTLVAAVIAVTRESGKTRTKQRNQAYITNDIGTPTPIRAPDNQFRQM